MGSEKDIITKKPRVVKLLDEEQWEIMEDHIDIIQLLRKQTLTVKEIHSSFVDPKTDKKKYAMKTVYRYLEKLTEAELVEIQGYREGKRVPERLYGRTATVYFPQLRKDESTKWDSEKGKNYVDRMALIINQIENKLEIKQEQLDTFYSVFKEFSMKQHHYLMEAMSKVENNEDLAEHYANTDIDRINEMNQYASIIAVFLRHPDLLERFREIFDN